MSNKLTLMICSNCSVALLYPHESLIKWLKCELCGFCILVEENDKRGK